MGTDKAKAQGYPTPAADRLYDLTSRLDLDKTAMQDWKLPMVSVTAAVKVK